jgi:UDP-N-acetylmuramoylalanine--D-glutamate ligase
MTPQSAPPTHPVHQPTTLIVGLGRTGWSCARYLHAQGVSFAVIDSRTAPPNAAALRSLAPHVQLRCGAFDPSLPEGIEQVVVSPGVSLQEPFLKEAAARGIPIIGDIELFVRAARAPIAAVTGTNGKSTVTTLLAHMAQACGKRVLAGGNLGRPALELLDEPVPELYVLELSSFQLDTTASLRAAAACVLNVSSDHMDRYASLADYARSKARIFERCANAVVNLDDPLVRDMAQGVPHVLGFSLLENPCADYRIAHDGEDVLLLQGTDPIIALSQLKIAGLHNAANALAALAMAQALELPRTGCLTALREFPGLPHRSQWVAEVGGVRYLDDSKGTNVGATLAAVAGTPGTLLLICGGQGKGQDFAPLAAGLQGKVRHAVTLGQDAALLEAALQGVCPLQRARDMEQAVRLAAAQARAGETVLLSPACASLDMFRDYAHRGDVFAAAVRGLAGASGGGSSA